MGNRDYSGTELLRGVLMSLYTSMNNFFMQLYAVKGTQILSHLGRNCDLKLCYGGWIELVTIPVSSEMRASSSLFMLLSLCASVLPVRCTGCD